MEATIHEAWEEVKVTACEKLPGGVSAVFESVFAVIPDWPRTVVLAPAVKAAAVSFTAHIVSHELSATVVRA